MLVKIDGDNVIVDLMFQYLWVGHRAGRNDADDIAFDESILVSCEFCVFGLLKIATLCPALTSL